MSPPMDVAGAFEREFGPGVSALLKADRPAHLASVDETSLTDWGMAEIVAKSAGDGIRRVLDIGEWRAFDGRVWSGGEAAVKCIERAVVNAGTKLYERAPELEQRLSRRASAAGLRAMSDIGVKAILSRLAAVESIGCKADIFDRNGELLNVANGTVDLRTGELRHHQREDFITSIIDIPYSPEAKAERWESFLFELFEPNPEIPEYLQRAIGYAATGSMREHVFHLLIGAGRNGKSVFVETLASVFGDYGLAIAADTLAKAHDLQRPRPDVALMRGRRFVFSQEANRGTPLDEALIKKLTGGDTLSARLLHQNPVNFKSVAKLFLSSNHAPEVQGTETAIWRRMRLIQFQVSFAGREDVGLTRTLERERAGILAWIVRGARRYFVEGLDAPESVMEATIAYQAQQDQVGRFLEDKIERVEGFTMAASELQTTYVAWCSANGEKDQKASIVAEYLASKGIDKKRFARGIRYLGITLKPESGDD